MAGIGAVQGNDAVDGNVVVSERMRVGRVEEGVLSVIRRADQHN